MRDGSPLSSTTTCVHLVMPGRSTTALVGATLLENFGVFRLQLLFCWQLLLVSGGFRRIFRVFPLFLSYLRGWPGIQLVHAPGFLLLFGMLYMLGFC